MNQPEFTIQKSLLDGSLLKSVNHQIEAYKKTKSGSLESESDHIKSLSQVFEIPEVEVEKLSASTIVSHHHALSARDKLYSLLSRYSKEFILVFLVSIILILSVLVIQRISNRSTIEISVGLEEDMKKHQQIVDFTEIYSTLSEVRNYQNNYLHKNGKYASSLSELDLKADTYFNYGIGKLGLNKNGDIYATPSGPWFKSDTQIIISINDTNKRCITNFKPTPDWCKFKDSSEIKSLLK